MARDPCLYGIRVLLLGRCFFGFGSVGWSGVELAAATLKLRETPFFVDTAAAFTHGARAFQQQPALSGDVHSPPPPSFPSPSSPAPPFISDCRSGTGGWLDFLRDLAAPVLPAVDPEAPDEMRDASSTLRFWRGRARMAWPLRARPARFFYPPVAPSTPLGTAGRGPALVVARPHEAASEVMLL